jgi:hypothetical protein
MRLKIAQPAQCMLARLAAHLERRLQAGATIRTLRTTKNGTLPIFVKINARHTRRFVQRGD